MQELEKQRAPQTQGSGEDDKTGCGRESGQAQKEAGSEDNEKQAGKGENT